MKNDCVLNLAGTWELSLSEQPPETFAHRIQLPGSLQAQGFGDDVTIGTPWTGQIIDRSWFESARYAPYRRPGNLKIPFWLQPEKHFAGTAWFQRDVSIPEAWTGKRITLFLERPHIESRVWLDGREIGSNNSLSAPHVYDLGLRVSPGPHRLTIRVDNALPVDVGINSHSVTDHTQTNWNGVIGRIELFAGPPVWIDEIQAYPDIARKSVRLKVSVGNATGTAGRGTLEAGGEKQEIAWSETGGAAELEVPLGPDARLWDEFDPCLQRLAVRLGDDEKTVVFGLREVGVRGTQITVNGRPVFLRGTLECCVFPRTGYPPTGVAEWKRILGIVKEYGFNHVRFHSWCPPEAAFDAADELGLYLQVECASWANTSTRLGEGLPVDDWLYEEGRRIIRAHGNHPSFLLMTYGNEPGTDRDQYTAYLTRWVEYWKRKEPRRLHTSAAGWPTIPINDYRNIPEPRLYLWGAGLSSRLNGLPPATMADYREFTEGAPIVSHEIGQWCVYPDFTEIPKYTGLLKAKNFEIFRETLEANHMGAQAAEFVRASGRLQVLCYREEFETALRTRGFGGYQALQMNDFPGQGTALVGWMNPFWESKGYATAGEFRRFNSPTVLLARLERRVFTPEMTLHAGVEVAHFGPAPLKKSRAWWRLEDEKGRVHLSGEFPARTIPTGGLAAIGDLALPLRGLPAPAKYRLATGLSGSSWENDWEIWLYPGEETASSGEEIHVVRDWKALNDLARSSAESMALFLPNPREVNPGIAVGFSPIFWNTAWTRAQAPHTLGILCDPAHPVLAGFPTEFHTNWQWWEPLHGAAAFVLDSLPPGFRPLVQLIDDWSTNRRLGALFEVRVGNCRVIASGLQLDEGVASRQLRRSIFAYMKSSFFQPECRLAAADFACLLGGGL